MPTLYFLSAPPVSPTAATEQFSPAAVLGWLQTRATANQAAFSKDVCQYIGTIHRSGLDGQAMFEVAELLRPAVLAAQAYLLTQIVGDSFPLPAERQAAAELALNLGRQFGQMYSVLLQAFDAAPSALLERYLCLLLHRLMRCLSQLLLAYYCLHLKIPAWLWRDLHALYRLALQKKKHDSRYEDETSSHLGNPSVEEIYLQALLLGLADPYTLQPQEIVAVFPYLELWSSRLRLRPPIQGVGDEGWRVRLDLDRPPVWPERGKESEGLVLDLSELARQLVSHVGKDLVRCGRFEPRSGVGDAAALSHDLLLQLAHRWRNQAVPFATVTGDGGLRLVSGFRSIHALLHPEGSVGKVPRIWDVAQLADGMLACDSSGGDGGIAVGALFSYALPSQNDGWGLAVVDRIMLDRMGGVIKFVLRKVADKVVPAGLQPAAPDASKFAAYQRALLYIDDGSRPVRSYVVMETLRNNEGNLVRLLTQDGMVFVRLTRRENLSVGCMRFECAAAVE